MSQNVGLFHLSAYFCYPLQQGISNLSTFSKLPLASRFKTYRSQTPEFKLFEFEMLFPENFVLFENESSTDVWNRISIYFLKSEVPIV